MYLVPIFDGKFRLVQSIQIIYDGKFGLVKDIQDFWIEICVARHLLIQVSFVL